MSDRWRYTEACEGNLCIGDCDECPIEDEMFTWEEDEADCKIDPVKHGHWIFNPKDAIEMMFTLPKCSECGAESPNGGNYCPNCGARMGEFEDEESAM